MFPSTKLISAYSFFTNLKCLIFSFTMFSYNDCFRIGTPSFDHFAQFLASTSRHGTPSLCTPATRSFFKSASPCRYATSIAISYCSVTALSIVTFTLKSFLSICIPFFIISIIHHQPKWGTPKRSIFQSLAPLIYWCKRSAMYVLLGISTLNKQIADDKCNMIRNLQISSFTSVTWSFYNTLYFVKWNPVVICNEKAFVFLSPTLLALVLLSYPYIRISLWTYRHHDFMVPILG